ncbi:MAG: hypothetical protein JWQ90_2332 [Hydrocarboniphaga sp.]|uniref:SEC-C domain-containing protein n=1 Tax=Hydrocarboniphaga sp. TaxID=2033016 RepID=UPI00260DFE19|nr:SEC-C metal-binding domain-containing protein [Hydrocarboniphaga sp.]MDB5969882.1 hypothetical protein [Hydrocarboniphaga sp.]
MQIKAAVVHANRGPLVIESIEVDEPGTDQVLVRNDPCPCGSASLFQELLHAVR